MDNNPDNNQTQIPPESPSLFGIILGGALTIFPIIILILWVRWLYNTGSPKS